jgi:hypothetical protein
MTMKVFLSADALGAADEDASCRSEDAGEERSEGDVAPDESLVQALTASRRAAAGTA